MRSIGWPLRVALFFAFCTFYMGLSDSLFSSVKDDKFYNTQAVIHRHSGLSESLQSVKSLFIFF